MAGTSQSSQAIIHRRPLAGAVIALLAVIGLVIIDPFRWHFIERLAGPFNPTLAAMPAESHMYVGLNLNSMNLADLAELEASFAAATAGSGQGLSAIRPALDSWLAEALGLSIEEDLSPWLGQYVSLAIVTLETNTFGEITNIEWILTAETRDKNASDRFLAELAAAWASSRQETATSETYARVPITSFEDLAFGRARRLVLFGSTASVLRRALDSQRGDSLEAAVAFQEAIRQLPAERLLTTYIDGEPLNRHLANLLPAPLPRISPENLPTAAIQNVALGLSLVDEGVSINAVTTYAPERLTVLQRTALQTHVSQPETPSRFPADTIFYLVGQGVDLFWASLRQALIAEIGRTDFSDSMRLFAEEFDINPDEDFFPLLDGEAALGLHPVAGGNSRAGNEGQLAATLLIGSSDPTTLDANLKTFSEKIANPQGGLGLIIQSQSRTGDTIYQFETPLMPEIQVSYGVSQGYFLASSNASTLQALPIDDGPLLADRSDYQQVWAVFPDDMAPGLFVDVSRTLAVLAQNQMMSATEYETLAAWLSPISHVAAANQAGEQHSQITLLVFVEQE